MKTFKNFMGESITSKLFKLARMSADARAVKRSIETGSLKPIERREWNKLVGRKALSKIFWRGP